MFLFVWHLMVQEDKARAVPFSEFVAAIESDQVAEVRIRPTETSATFTYTLAKQEAEGAKGVSHETIGIAGERIDQLLREHGVKTTYIADESSPWTGILL